MTVLAHITSVEAGSVAAVFFAGFLFGVLFAKRDVIRKLRRDDAR